MNNYLVVALGVVDDGGPVLDVDLAHGVHPQRGVPPQLDVSEHAEVDGLEGTQLVEVGLLRIRSLEVDGKINCYLVYISANTEVQN